jgi:hypothetical protein
MEKVFIYICGDEVGPGSFTDANFCDTGAAVSVCVTHCTSEE